MAEPSINVMPDLQPVLREFTKAVLRDMPTDVIAYSKDYFVEKAAALRMESYTLPPSESPVFKQLSGDLQEQVEAVFKRYDVDMDGGLTVDEINSMLQDLGGLFGFSSEVNGETLMALLDVDGDRHVSWQVHAEHPAARLVDASLPGVSHARSHHLRPVSTFLRSGLTHAQSGWQSCRNRGAMMRHWCLGGRGALAPALACARFRVSPCACHVPMRGRCAPFLLPANWMVVGGALSARRRRGGNCGV